MAHTPTTGTGTWTRTYTYDTTNDNNHLVTTTHSGGNKSYTHDAHGNMDGIPHLNTVEWDHADQLRHVEITTGQDVYFTYDGAGQRVRKVWITNSGNLRRERIYLGGFEIWRSYDKVAGNWVLQDERETVHIADDARRVCMIETLTLDGGSAPGTITPRFRYELDDHLGTCCVEVDETGSVISYEEYHPYGTSAYRAFQSSEVSARRYRYTGKERDEETALYYCGARYYAPWLGRWPAADPAGLVDGPGLYNYCRGSPVTLRDPNGMEGDEDIHRTAQGGGIARIAQLAEHAELKKSFEEEVAAGRAWGPPPQEPPPSKEKPLDPIPAVAEQGEDPYAIARFEPGEFGAGVFPPPGQRSAGRTKAESIAAGIRAQAEAAGLRVFHEEEFLAIAGAASVVLPAAVAGLAGIRSGVITAAGAGSSTESSTSWTQAEVMRALRQSGTPVGHATAKLLKRGEISLVVDPSRAPKLPGGLLQGGEIQLGGTQITLFPKNIATAEQAAGLTAHEARHFLQQLTPRTYHQGHEIEAFLWQKQVDPQMQLRSVDEILRQYPHVRPAPTGWTPRLSPNEPNIK